MLAAISSTKVSMSIQIPNYLIVITIGKAYAH